MTSGTGMLPPGRPQKNAVGLNHTEHTGKIESINSQR